MPDKEKTAGPCQAPAADGYFLVRSYQARSKIKGHPREAGAGARSNGNGACTGFSGVLRDLLFGGHIGRLPCMELRVLIAHLVMQELTPNREARASHATIARHLGLADSREVRRATAKLVERGYLTNLSAGGGNTPAVRRVVIPRGEGENHPGSQSPGVKSTQGKKTPGPRGKSTLPPRVSYPPQLELHDSNQVNKNHSARAAAEAKPPRRESYSELFDPFLATHPQLNLRPGDRRKISRMIIDVGWPRTRDALDEALGRGAGNSIEYAMAIVKRLSESPPHQLPAQRPNGNQAKVAALREHIREVVGPTNGEARL